VISVKSSKPIIGFVVSLVIALPALAAGPLVIFDPATEQPYFYPGPLDLYTDIDVMFSLKGPVAGAEADARAIGGIAEWSNVATSTFSGSVAGDFASIGLPDINVTNATLVIGNFNGGGYHVIYDNDGSITSALAGPGVLGFSTPEFAETGTPHLTESYAVLNGATVATGDAQALAWSGVFTHEFGHGINLAHTQTNGAVGFFGDDRGPATCPPLAGSPDVITLETMYPFIDSGIGGSGPAQFTIDVLDDISSVSDVYPSSGWPADFGTISGTILRSDGATPITGVNVVVRNVADLWGDCSSTLSGAFTQGIDGADGRYHFNGLTPGSQYLIYVDAIVAGGFSTPPARPLPGPEEYWNGVNESSDPDTDLICEFTPITPVAGMPFTADVVFNFGIFLGDDDFERVLLPFAFEFCGQTYGDVYVGSNGYLTFGAGDTDFSPSIGDFLGGPPRIAPLWVDLNPTQGGSITVDSGPGLWTVTYNKIPEFFDVGANTFSVTLRSDNTFNVSYGSMSAVNGLAGRTEGGGVPDPGQTDLSAATQPIGNGEGSVYEFFATSDNDLANLLLDYGLCDPFIFVFDDAIPGVCYASTGRSGPTNGALLTIDTGTGAGTLIGQTGLDRLPALAINSSREIWGSSGGGGSQLVRISASDALTQVVAPMRNSANAFPLSFVDAMAFGANGVLYAINTGNSLWTVSTSTGFATEIGFTGLPPAPFLVGMAFDPRTGRLYASTGGLGAADQIYELDRMSGAATLVGSTGLGGGAIPDVMFQDVGTMFGSKSAGGGAFNLISIDKTTGAGTVIGDIGFASVSGLVWSPHSVIEANFDIKPGGCPNPFNIKNFDARHGGNQTAVFPTALAGDVGFDVSQIDLLTLTIDGVPPKTTSFDDVTGPPDAPVGCCASGDGDLSDGITDLEMKFNVSALAGVIRPGFVGAQRLLTIRGFLLDGRPFEGTDCIVFVGRPGESGGDGDGDVPVLEESEPEIKEAFPNPFNPVTRIAYVLPRSDFVSLVVYDIKGRRVETLVSGTRPAGRHVVEWDASRFASGIYFYRFIVGNVSETRKMILLK